MAQKQNGKDKSYRPLFSPEEEKLLKSILEQNPPVVNLAIGELHIDTSYNERPRERLTYQIHYHFSAALLGVLMVARRPDGSCWIIDGATRQAGLLRRGESKRIVPCQVFETEGPKQEALLFAWFSSKRARAQIPLANNLNALGVAGVDKGFKKLLTQCGFEILKLQGPGYYHRAFTLDDDGSALQKTLFSIKSCWLPKPGARQARIPGTTVLGVAKVYCIYGQRPIDDQVRRIMTRFSPTQLYEKAVAKHVKAGGRTPNIHPNDRPGYIARILVDEINRNPGKSPKLDLAKLDDPRLGI
jgi:hypothetical protein